MLLPVFCVLALSGCAQSWFKPGGNAGEFAKDRYDCLQNSQQAQSSFSFNAVSGGASSGMATNGPLFNACMNARGYTLQTVNPSGQPNGATASGSPPPWKAQRDELDARGRANCANVAYASYYAQTACQTKDVSFAHLANQSKITAEQKAVFPDVRAAIDALTKENLEMDRKYGGERGARRATLYMSKYWPQVDQNNLDLYNGQISWGEYNKRRRDIANDFNSTP